MKTNHKIMAVLLAALMLLVFAGSCLADDSDATGFTSTTFADVAPASWFYSGVRDAYNSGLMEGVGNKQFNPDSNFTVAQAIAVAARMYALYNKNSINTDGSGPWYEPYIAYAANHGLLNDALKNTANPDKVNATRAQAAYLFYGVLSKAEPTPQYINTSTIPDLDEVPVDYGNAVANMYKLGIFTGMEDGNFVGNADVTRAQISVIISRILDPSYRIPYDSKYNNELAGQEGNLFMYDGVIVYDDDYTYFVVSDTHNSDKCSIVKRDNATMKAQIIYAGNGKICNLRLKDNNLYFIEHMENEDLMDYGFYYSYLVKYDLKTNWAHYLYKSELGKSAYPFELYGDKIYINTQIDGVTDKIICLNQDGSIDDLFTYRSGGRLNNKLFLFNDKLYFTSFSNGEDNEWLYSYDLNTKETVKIMDNTNIVMANGIIYLKENFTNEDYSVNNDKIYRINLVTDNDYEDDKELVFDVTTGNWYFGFSVINQNIYVCCNGSYSVQKVLGDGSLVAVNENAGAIPYNFVITGSGECFYTFCRYYAYPFYYAPGYPYANGIVDYLRVGDFDTSHAVKSGATGYLKD